MFVFNATQIHPLLTFFPLYVTSHVTFESLFRVVRERGLYLNKLQPSTLIISRSVIKQDETITKKQYHETHWRWVLRRQTRT